MWYATNDTLFVGSSTVVSRPHFGGGGVPATCDRSQVRKTIRETHYREPRSTNKRHDAVQAVIHRCSTTTKYVRYNVLRVAVWVVWLTDGGNFWDAGLLLFCVLVGFICQALMT